MSIDKEKQITEMAKDLYGEIDYDVNCYSDDNYSEVDFNYVETAKNIVEKGWVKLPKDSVMISKEEYVALKTIEKYHINSCGKDSVVLSKENYDKLCHLAYFGYDDAYEKGSKETAEKIYYKAEKKAYFQDGGYYDKDRYYLDMEDLKEILKQCGVEIKE